MSATDHRRNDDSRRNTILVASLSPAFTEIVGEMLASGGFTFATMMQAEPGWLSLTRTRPALVMCDATGPEDGVRRLIAEAFARGLPVLLLGMTEEQQSVRGRHVPSAVVWLPFPLARVDFQASIEKLLMATPASDHQFVLSGAGVTLQGGLVGTRRRTGDLV